jgi:hypothetical protein
MPDMTDLTLEEQFEGTQLLRRCDALDLLVIALFEFSRYQDLHSERDVANAREELRTLRDEAYAAHREFGRVHGLGDL